MKLLRAAIALTIGVVLARSIAAPPSGIETVIALVAVLVVLLAAIGFRKHVPLAVLLVLAVLGLVRSATADTSTSQLQWSQIPRSEARVDLEGTLLSDPAPSNDRTRLRLTVTPENSPSSKYLVDVYTERLHDRADIDRRSDDFRYGDVYRFAGRFVLATGRSDIAGFVSTTSVELIGQHGGNNLRGFVGGVRADIATKLVDSLGSRTGGLAAALLVGDRTKLLPETISNFRTAGLSHVLAISGLHIAMVGGIIMAMSAWAIGRQRQVYLIAPLIGVWGYAALAGFTPSVTRAAIMFSVYLMARLLGRQRSVLPPLALAATIMLAIEPDIISSISFQLSFAAVLGIALLSTRFATRSSDWVKNSQRVPSIAKSPVTGVLYGVSVSLAATIATAPIVAFHFGEIPIWGIPSTLLVVPVLPLFIGGSLLAGVAGYVFAQPPTFVGVIAHGFGNYVSFVSDAFGSIPVGPLDAGGWSYPLIFGWYAALILLLNRRRVLSIVSGMIEAVHTTSSTAGLGTPVVSKRRSQVFPVVVVWIVAAVSLVGFVATSPQTSGDLTASFFETNRGDMIFIETPSGARLLVDGGDDPDVAVRNLESALPPLDRRIDVLLSTHPDADHLGGLERVVERFDVGTIIDSGVAHDSDLYKSWELLLDGDDRVVTAQPGLIVALEDEVRLTVLQTSCVVIECSNFNDEGAVARLEFGDVSILLTGDVTSGGENDLLLTGQPVRSTVLKAGHHGSRSSSTQQFLDAVDPAVAVVTTGIRNQFGHPHDDVMARLADELSHDAVFVTRDRGTVTVITDGERVWVETER